MNYFKTLLKFTCCLIAIGIIESYLAMSGTDFGPLLVIFIAGLLFSSLVFID